MNEVIRAAVEIQEFCQNQHWHFCFIGGLALQRWGEPSETVDVDLTLLTGFALTRYLLFNSWDALPIKLGFSQNENCWPETRQAVPS